MESPNNQVFYFNSITFYLFVLSTHPVSVMLIKFICFLHQDLFDLISLIFNLFYICTNYMTTNRLTAHQCFAHGNSLRYFLILFDNHFHFYFGLHQAVIEGFTHLFVATVRSETNVLHNCVNLCTEIRANTNVTRKSQNLLEKCSH